MHYVGIDVGENKFFIACYSESGVIDTEYFDRPKAVYNFVKNKKIIIAIDAPSQCCNSNHKQRTCEDRLGIVGFFLAPKKRDLAEPWMQSGFSLWELLKSEGYKPLTKKPAKIGNLIEVHPTISFKSLKNPEVEPRLWISRENPSSKQKRKGINERRKILKSLSPVFERHSKIIDVFNIDYLDALIAAYTAEQLFKGKGRGFGNSDGWIWVP